MANYANASSLPGLMMTPDETQRDIQSDLTPRARQELEAEMARGGNPIQRAALQSYHKQMYEDNAGAPSGGGIPIDSPEAKALLAQSAAERGGALSQVIAPQAAPQEQPAQGPGALSQMADMYKNFKLPSIEETMQKYIPQDDSSQRYLALASALGRPTGFGSFGEKVANVADALESQKMEQQKLRLQYLPAIMQQVASQQQTMFNMQRNAAMIGSLPSLMGGQSQPLPTVAAAPGAPQTGQAGPGQQPPSPMAAPQQAGQPPNPAPTAQPPAQPPGGTPQQQAPGAAPSPQVQQAVANVQQQWQKMGMTYPITLAEAYAVATSADPQASFTALMQKHSEPSAAGMLAIQAGMQPGTPEYQAYMKAAAAKGNYIAPVAGRAGGYNLHADGRKEFNPQVPEGMIGQQNPVTGKMEFIQDPGLTAGIATAAAAKLGGTNTQTLASPEMSPRDAQGRVVPKTIADTINGPGQPSGQPQGVGLAPGQTTMADNAANSMKSHFDGVIGDSTTAQTNTSYLQEMQRLAKTAAVGPFADKVRFMQAMMSQAGISGSAEKALTDANLFDKYANQIAVKLGVGSMGTDAARSLIQAANPNSHMTSDAIQEASNTLIGANDMAKARMKVLSPYANKDAGAYFKNDMDFTQNSDPVLWSHIHQYKAFPAGSQQSKAYMASVLKQDPQFLQKMTALDQLGAFK